MLAEAVILMVKITQIGQCGIQMGVVSENRARRNLLAFAFDARMMFYRNGSRAAFRKLNQLIVAGFSRASH
jgi:hypothetical protein